MNIEELAENLGLDEEEFVEILELYVETTSTDLEELKAAIAAKDAESAHKKSHSIKGSSGNMGLTELFEKAKAIDDRARVNSLDGLENMVLEFTAAFEKLKAALK
jgi:HPt (histidine-containing phosphotransfer) domain-containing protein